MEERFCAHCGSRPIGESCCWLVTEGEEWPRPHELVPARAWEEWDADQQFLITVLMEQFGGAAEEWELLCRLPWARWRLQRCACDPWGRWTVWATDYPCLKEPEERGTRYFLTDMARHAYEQRHALPGPVGQSRPARAAR